MGDDLIDLFVYAPSQWETTLQWNVFSHWLGIYTKWSLLHNVNVFFHLLEKLKRHTYKMGPVIIGWYAAKIFMRATVKSFLSRFVYELPTYCARWNGVVLSVYNNHIYPSGHIRWFVWHRLYQVTQTLGYYQTQQGFHSVMWANCPKSQVASFTKEVNPRLAKRPLKTNGRLANCGLTFLAKEATGGLDITVCSL